MRKSKKKKGDMVFKLDLEKAYDRVNWRFLRNTLVKFNFPAKIISLIMFGLTNASNSILWNGSKQMRSHLREDFVKEIRSHHTCLSYVWSVLVL
jgi:hypothetical protein